MATSERSIRVTKCLARILHEAAAMQYPQRPNQLRELVQRGRLSYWPESKLLSG